MFCRREIARADRTYLGAARRALRSVKQRRVDATPTSLAGAKPVGLVCSRCLDLPQLTKERMSDSRRAAVPMIVHEAFALFAVSATQCADFLGQERHALEVAPQAPLGTSAQEGKNMLETIAVVLVVLWLLGLVTSYTMGGLIHALLVIAIVVIVIRVIQGRRV
jgi:hypothetical protein